MIQFIIYTLINPISKKRLFGKDYIFLYELVAQLTQLYHVCSTLGYCYKDKIHILLELMTDHKEKIPEQIAVIGEMAQHNYEKMKSTTRDFTGFVMDIEVPPLMSSLHKAGIIKYENVSDFLKVSKEKIIKDYAAFYFQTIAYAALGFGLKFPEVTKSFLSSSVDKDKWELAYKSGLDIPKEQEIVPLDIQEKDVKELIKPYIEVKRPDLLQSLNLT